MNILLIKDFFMWCTVINLVLLIITGLFCTFAGNWIYKIHRKFFDIPRETFNAIIYAFLGFYKLLFIVFNLIPYIALLIII